MRCALAGLAEAVAEHRLLIVGTVIDRNVEFVCAVILSLLGVFQLFLAQYMSCLKLTTLCVCSPTLYRRLISNTTILYLGPRN